MIKTLTEENFSETLTSSNTLILHFWSDFCAPCKMMSNVLHRIEEKSPDTLTIGEINSFKHPDWSEAFSVQSTPTIILFSNGKYKSRLIGAQPVSIIESWIDRSLNN